MTAISLSRIHFPVTTLGPGNRLGIWFQGCSIRCPGCISADTWSLGLGTTTVDAIVDAIDSWLTRADGVTISGGEPFDQPAALAQLLKEIRRRSTLDVLVYSGHAYDAIREWVASEPGLIDALISEPYQESMPQTLALRGSDNQELHLLTALGNERYAGYDRTLEAADRRFDVMFDQDGTVWLAGIPTRVDFARFRRAVETSGNFMVVSASPSGEARE